MARTATFACAAICLAVFIALVPLLAHHAFSSEFDAAQPVRLRGKITKMEWINPHAWQPRAG